MKLSKLKFDLYLVQFTILYCAIHYFIRSTPSNYLTIWIEITGYLSFYLICFVLSIGPIAKLFPEQKWILQYRRHTGIFTFIVCTVHSAYSNLLYHDVQVPYYWITYFNGTFSSIAFEIFGVISYLLLIPMVITSNHFMVRYLGATLWKKLHYMVYPSFYFVLLHLTFGVWADYQGFPFLIPFIMIVFLLHIRAILLESEWINQKLMSTTNKYLEKFVLNQIPQNTVQPDIPYQPHDPINHPSDCIHLDFVGDKIIEADPNLTILDNSLKASIDHVYECGGSARCSTCRVVIIDGLSNCNPRNMAEQELASAKNFTENVRLACQTSFKGNLKLKRLVFDTEDIQDAEAQTNHLPPAAEQNLAVLFSDIRSFTPFAESNLPYDVVHILNRYFNAIGKPIDDNHGYIDKYMGDGIMVLFGLDKTRTVHPCIDAMNAAIKMSEALKEFNHYLNLHFGLKLQVGIGIHYGTVITGGVGYRLKKDFTALGDTVNLASRIESYTKTANVQILISESVKEYCPQTNYKVGKSFDSTLKGKSGSYQLYELLNE